MAEPWGWDSAWPAPAKVNRFLHVVGRRNDGYHLLQTVFQFIDWHDTLHFTADDDIVLETPTPGIPDAHNLVVRAARLLQAHSGVRTGARIRLEKRLPMGGGLGGGSSDAATVLIALNYLWRTGLPRAELQALGLALGADVPVFVHGRTTFAEGVGERFSDVDVPAQWLLLTVPPVAVPTAAIFGDASLRRDTPTMRPTDWRPEQGGNDLEAVVERRYEPVAQHLRMLRTLGPARMSGSGACCFVPFDDAAAARRARARLPADMTSVIAPTLAAHPLVEV